MTDRGKMDWAPRAPSAGSDLDDERVRFWSAIEANGTRIDGLERDMQKAITQAVKDAMPTPMPTAKQLQVLDLFVEKQTQSIAFRQSVIDKTLTAFVWALILGVGIIVKEYFAAHGWKP